MKKLMFVAAVAASMVALADNSIVSQNIVGYQALGVESTGFKFTVPTFEAVSGSIDIQDIQLVFDSEVTGGDNLQILGTGGEMLEQYFWLPAQYMWPEGPKDGWTYDGAYATKEIKNGQGFLIDIVDATTKIQYAGQVGSEKTVVSDVATGFNFTGNNIPRNIDIQEIQLAFSTEVTGGDNLQILGTGGEMLEQYFWLPAQYMWPEGPKDGWTDGGAYATKEIKAGEGFLIDIVDPTTTITLPKAIQE